MDNSNIVWKNRVDEKYDCYVERKDSHNGVLKVDLNGENLLSKDVPISYGAAFGPDVSDVNDWSEQVIDFIDGLQPEGKKE